MTMTQKTKNGWFALISVWIIGGGLVILMGIIKVLNANQMATGLKIVAVVSGLVAWAARKITRSSEKYDHEYDSESDKTTASSIKPPLHPLTYWSLILFLVPPVGFILALTAFILIRSSEGKYRGLRLAKISLILNAIWLMYLIVMFVMIGSGKRDKSDYEKPLPPNAPVLQVTYEYAAGSLPLFVAMKKGYFRKRGIDIKPIKVGALPALQFSDMDIINGHSFSLMAQSSASPKSISFVHPFSYTKIGPMINGLLVKRMTGITKWSDFKGRKIENTCFALRSFADSSLISKIMKHNGAIKEFNFKFEFGDNPAKVFEEQERVIAMYGWGSDVKDLLKRKPNDYVLLGKNLPAEVISDPYFVACTYINLGSSRTKPNVVRKYIEAIDEAIDYLRKNPKRALAIVPKYMPFTPDEAAKLPLYHFHKSTELIDFDSLRSCTDQNLRKYFYGKP
jgi:ABC-type nitrate/sulfonate/bicarbonate transport system substrate-binding protein